MAKKYYAVRSGRTPGIYENWEAARAQVEGFSGAAYKSFSLYEEAVSFLNGDEGNALSNLKRVVIEEPVPLDSHLQALSEVFDAMEACTPERLSELSDSFQRAEKKYGYSLTDPFLFDAHPDADLVAFVDGGGDKDPSKSYTTSLLPFGAVVFQNQNGIADKPLFYRHVFDKSNPDFNFMFHASNVSAEILADLFVMRRAELSGKRTLRIYQDNTLPAKYFSGEFQKVHKKEDPLSTCLLQIYIRESIRHLSEGMDIAFFYVPSEHSTSKTRAKKQELYEAESPKKLPFEAAEFYNAVSDALADFSLELD